MPEKNRSLFEIRLGIMQTIKKGLEEGGEVGTWYVMRNLGIGYTTLKKHEQFLTENGYLTRENRYLDLTDKAKDVVGYFERKIVSGLSKKPCSADQFIESLAGKDNFKPTEIIRKKPEEPEVKIVKRTHEKLMFDFLNEVKRSENGAIPFRVRNAINTDIKTTNRYGEEARINDFIDYGYEKIGGKDYLRYFITEKGKKWLTETPEKKALSKVIF